MATDAVIVGDRQGLMGGGARREVLRPAGTSDCAQALMRVSTGGRDACGAADTCAATPMYAVHGVDQTAGVHSLDHFDAAVLVRIVIPEVVFSRAAHLDPQVLKKHKTKGSVPMTAIHHIFEVTETVCIPPTASRRTITFSTLLKFIVFLRRNR